MAMFTLLRIPRQVGQIYQSEQGSSFAALGGEMLFKTTADQSSGAFSFLEYTAPAHFSGPPAHYHKKMHEGFYCLAGTLSIEMDGRTSELRPGAYAMVPPSVVHRFSNATPSPVRFLGIQTPGGMERYFRDLMEMIKKETAWPPRDMRQLIELGERYDTFFTQPPA